MSDLFKRGPRIHYVKVPWKDPRDNTVKSQPVMCIAVDRIVNPLAIPIADKLVRVGISVRSWDEKTWNRKRMHKIALGRCRCHRISTRTVEYDLHELGLIDAPSLGWGRNVEQIKAFLALFVGSLEYVPRLKREAKLMNLAGIVPLEHYTSTIACYSAKCATKHEAKHHE